MLWETMSTNVEQKKVSGQRTIQINNKMILVSSDDQLLFICITYS